MRPSGRPRLDVSPSLNRTVLADFPGLPGGMAGSRANAWLAAWGVARRMATRPEVRDAIARRAPSTSPVLGVGSDPVEATVSSAWAAALDGLARTGDDAGCRLADELGIALGDLVATLVTGPPGARAARPDWPSSQWERWASVRRIAVGGGLVRGALGGRMVCAAQDWLARTGVPVGVDLVERPEGLVLRGAAALLPGAGVVVDCGSTTVKSAVRRGAPGDQLVADASVAAPQGSGSQILDAITEVVAGRAPAAPGSAVLFVTIAVATYVDETGQPYAGQLGPYAPLGDLDLRAELESRIRHAVDRPASVRVVHDGAAALLGARDDDPGVDAAIVLGTSIGSGLR